MKKKVHFLGVGGSGIGAVAILAQAAGFEVEGSDLQSETPYLSKVKAAGIKTYVGHSKEFLNGVDILAVTPAVFFQPSNPMLDEAKRQQIPTMSWQEFMGRYLHKGKTVVCVAGAHGKSTTTALLGLCFERSGLDPTVEVGASVLEWNSNIRVGSSDIFISEADEFYDNFLHYNPDTIIFTSIEYEHPDYFKNETQYFDSYRKFVSQLRGNKRLIVNLDDAGTHKLMHSLEKTMRSNLSVIGYTVSKPLFETDRTYKVSSVSHDYSTYNFSDPSGETHTVNLRATGRHNIYNSLAVATLSLELSVSFEHVQSVLASFTGIGRRLETIGEKSGVTVIDDYAHHPTEIKASLSAIRSRFPAARVLAIIEPHSYSRTKAVLNYYSGLDELAESIFVAPIYKARDIEDFGMNEQIICDSIGGACTAFTSIDTVIDTVIKSKSDYDIVIVMGAGKSYQIARDILKAL